MQIRKATLVVIEYGASWPRWLHPGHSGDLAVVAQHYEGPPSSLVTQVASRVSRLTSKGWQLEAMVLVSNGRIDPEAVASRSVVARGLMANLRAGGGVHFTLSVSDELGRRSAHSLTALAAALDPMAYACGVELSIRLGEKPPLYSRPPSSLPLSAAG
jgi:hypothetical protein